MARGASTSLPLGVIRWFAAACNRHPVPAAGRVGMLSLPPCASLLHGSAL